MKEKNNIKPDIIGSAAGPELSWLSDPDFFTVLTLGEEGVEKGFYVRHFCRLKDGMITER